MRCCLVAQPDGDRLEGGSAVWWAAESGQHSGLELHTAMTECPPPHRPQVILSNFFFF